jgi:hypothetical protein
MTKYILGFHGGGDMPTDPEVAEASMGKWIAWYQDMGKAVSTWARPRSP